MVYVHPLTAALDRSIHFAHSCLFPFFAPVDEVYDFNPTHMWKHGPVSVYKFTNLGIGDYVHDGIRIDFTAHSKDVDLCRAWFREDFGKKHIIVAVPKLGWAERMQHDAIMESQKTDAEAMFDDVFATAKAEQLVHINQEDTPTKWILIRFPEELSNGVFGSNDDDEIPMHFAPVKTNFDILGHPGVFDCTPVYFLATIKSRENRKVKARQKMTASERLAEKMKGMNLS